MFTDVLGALSDGSLMLGEELVGIHTDLEDVVQQGKDGRNGEGGNKQRTEPKLDDELTVLLKHLGVVGRQQIVLGPLGRLESLGLGLVLSLEVRGALCKFVLLVPQFLQDRDGNFLSLVDQLLTDEDNRKLNCQLTETTVCSTFVLWLALDDLDVFGDIVLKECDVDQGRVEVDKVEQEPLDNQRI